MCFLSNSLLWQFKGWLSNFFCVLNIQKLFTSTKLNLHNFNVCTFEHKVMVPFQSEYQKKNIQSFLPLTNMPDTFHKRNLSIICWEIAINIHMIYHGKLHFNVWNINHNMLSLLMSCFHCIYKINFSRELALTFFFVLPGS